MKPLRLLQSATLVCAEATLIHLVVALLTSYSATPVRHWGVLVAVTAIAAVATAWLEPASRAGRIRPLTAVLAIATIAWATKAQVAGLSVTAGWSALSELTNPDNERFVQIYIALGASMWAWWRGTRVLDLDHMEVVQLLRRGIVALVVAVGALSLLGADPGLVPGPGEPRVTIAAEIIIFLLFGFVGLSLTRIVAAEGEGVRSGQWQWLRSTMLSTLLILLGGLLLLAVVAEPAGALLREAFLWSIYALALVLSPVIWLVFGLFELIGQAFTVRDVTLAPPPTATAQGGAPPEVTLPTVPGAVLAVPVIILLLIPVVVLALLILFARRRRARPDSEAGEERQSIFSWHALGADLAGLLRGLKLARAGEGGLRAALGRLVSADPATRIRRRYVQLLIRGEAAERQRQPAQTPAEFAPALAAVSENETAVAMLTETYEQARYAPETVDDSAARRADAAWQALAQQDRRDDP